MTLYAYKLGTNITCLDAKTRFLNDSCQNYDECNALFVYAQRCLIESHNRRNPTDKKVLVTYVDITPEGEERILFGLIDLKSGVTAAGISKAVISMISLQAVSDNPLSAVVYDAAGRYSVDAYLQAAINNDELILFAPTLVPSAQLAKDVFRELSKNKEIKKVSMQVKRFTKDIIKEIETNPLRMVTPVEYHSIELLKKELRFLDVVPDAAGRMATEILSIPLAVVPSDLGELAKNPGNYVEKTLAESTEKVKEFVKKPKVKVRVRVKIKW